MSSPQHEPTMEEILASIRKIISEDAPAPVEAPVAAAAPVSPPVAPAPAPAPEPDVLDLTQEVVETPPPAPMPAPAPVVDDVVFQADTPARAPAASDSDIFSDRTRQAMDDAFARISDDEMPEPQPAPARAAPLPRVDGATVESVFERAVRESFEPVLRNYLADNSAAVIEGMKPVIREWMDQNFPPMLESAIRAEVERVVRSRRR
jgi:cell pole-organizing protein PopZ